MKKEIIRRIVVALLSGCKETTFRELITTLAYALDLDENRKLYHAWRVAVITRALAKMLLPDQVELAFYAALLHDIGAIGYSDYILHSPQIWPEYSADFLAGHTRRGAEIVQLIPRLQAAAPMIVDHHEWWDGSGYPAHKKGKDINPGGQLIRLADTVETIISAVPDLSISQLYSLLDVRVGKEFSRPLYQALQEIFADLSFWEQLRREEELAPLLAQIVREDHFTLSAPIESKTEPAKASSKTEASPATDPATDMELTLRVFARVIDAKHAYTAGHSERVATYAGQIAHVLGLPPLAVRQVRQASLLHDLGKIAVPKYILDKPSRLNKQETSIIHAHPRYSMELIDRIQGLRNLAPAAGYHHERLDGTGYPFGLKGEAIPVFARILAIADAFDAITSQRSYQPARPIKAAFKELRLGSGSHFDGEIVAVALTALNQEAAIAEVAPGGDSLLSSASMEMNSKSTA